MTDSSMDDFVIEKVLGKGSFGSVYLVRRKEDQKIYALKSVILEKLNKKEQQNSVNEVRILASVNHPNVIGYKEAFWDDNASSLNIVMEYADDGDLQTKIVKMRKEGGMFQENLIWSYSIQMIEGLKALHDKKIMHRDLKSANIFLVKDKHQCKLGDMNVSKVIKEKELLTQTGTPYYASPEVWRDEPYSYKSDLWSIGCVIYELCALRPPFKGKDLDELFLNVCKGKVDRISHVYSDDLWKMILMLLQVDVKKRCDCDKFLNSKLITRKIQEMKNENKEYRNLEKNKEINDNDLLLDTIKFDNILDIKRQLPTKKNYGNNNTDISSNKKINKKINKKKDINTNDNKIKNNRNISNNAIDKSNSIKYHKINNITKNKKILNNNKNIEKKKGIKKMDKEKEKGKEKLKSDELEKSKENDIEDQEIEKEKENDIIEEKINKENENKELENESDQKEKENDEKKNDIDLINKDTNSEPQLKYEQSSLLPQESDNSINNMINKENSKSNNNINNSSMKNEITKKNNYIGNSPNPKSSKSKGIIYQKPKMIEGSVKRDKKNYLNNHPQPMTTKRTAKKFNYMERNITPKRPGNKLINKTESNIPNNDKHIYSLRNKNMCENGCSSVTREKTQKCVNRPIETSPSANYNNNNMYMNIIKKKNYAKKIQNISNQRPQSATPSKKNAKLNNNPNNVLDNKNTTEIINYEINTNNNNNPNTKEFISNRENMVNMLINNYNKKNINFNSYNPNKIKNKNNNRPLTTTNNNNQKNHINHPVLKDLGFEMKNHKKISVKPYNKVQSRQKENLNKKRIIDKNEVGRDMTEPELLKMVNPIKINDQNRGIKKNLNISLSNQEKNNTFLHQQKLNKMARYNTNNPRYNQYYSNNVNQTNPQIFNNFVSINNLVSPNYPVKVINVFGE